MRAVKLPTQSLAHTQLSVSRSNFATVSLLKLLNMNSQRQLDISRDALVSALVQAAHFCRP